MSSDFLAYAVPVLWHGLQLTVLVTVLGIALALFTAFVAGLGRLSEHAVVRGISVFFIEVFRGTSLVVQLFFFYFALPAFGVQLSPLFAGVLAIGLNEGAYAAEIVRGAIVSRTAGQNEACIALSMGKSLRMRRVLIPQSVPAMLPPFGNVMVDTLKNSSLVSFIGVSELTFRGEFIRNAFGETLTVYLTLLVLYFILSQLLALLSRWLERRFAIDRPSRSIFRGAGMRPATEGVTP
ncbi:MAG TPA: ectoine/hydroxyectoine ABC transporter permease subunit EhuC [Segeticoccus sp.]|uniref:ectoine/hydroxyectoine ABC transporter permease subunit EhuC n=1 Tax=Segeticoccus sp. TaxID=2706531 RepID=UPI002D7F06D0|nr:ectoine/hydroxyectoine ABC transporter permease subunit EhuC [Segeticoccus sp.]HET8600929.1 ectoine/hydroxyectoine ABC transporter permease subunit EhuC [Segeticoccus sp.]